MEECCKTSCSCGCAKDRKNKLCQLTKPDSGFDPAEILPLVNDPKHICLCCGRLANDQNRLCQPAPLVKD